MNCLAHGTAGAGCPADVLFCNFRGEEDIVVGAPFIYCLARRSASNRSTET